MTESEGTRRLWESATADAMRRRRFLALPSAGGAAAVLAACDELLPSAGETAPASEPAQSASSGEKSPWFKDPATFIQRDDKGLEARLENMQGLSTPRHLFFVRNNSVSLDIEESDWRLSIEGDAGNRPTGGVGFQIKAGRACFPQVRAMMRYAFTNSSVQHSALVEYDSSATRAG